MRQMQRGFRLTCVVFLCAQVLAGCGGGSGTSPATPAPAPGSLTLSSAGYTVGQAAGSVTVTVNLAPALSGAVAVSYATSDGTAVAGTDYTSTHGTLTFAPNTTAQSFAVPISNATPYAGTRAFNVTLSAPGTGAVLGNPASASVTITGGAMNGAVQFGAASYTVAQTSGSVSVSVTRTGASSGAVSVGYATSNGTALAGTNYTSTSGILSWAANDTAAKTFTVPVSAAPLLTTSATFSVMLSATTGGATLATPSQATVTITPGGAAMPLSIRVSGNRLVDGNGNTVQLRGVNISGLEFVAIGNWDPANPWGNQTGDPTPNFSTIKTWGANAVRLPLNEASWLGLTCTDVGGNAGTANALIKADPGSNYQATVAQTVAQANAAGMYVILDLHWAAPNQNGTPLCPTAQNAMADADHGAAFWTSLANQFKNNPAVIFELFNEPFLNSAGVVGNTPWPDLLNGGTLSKFLYAGGSGQLNLSWPTAGMQQMLNAVRATGATNVVLTSTLAYSQQMDGWLQYKPSDPAGQLGAVWHPYPSSLYPTQVSCQPDGIITVGLPDCSALEMAAVQAILAAGYPVVATEFGDTIGGSTAPWASVLLPFADANGISYLGWTWDTWTGYTADVLITDAAGDPTQGYGTYVKQHYLCRQSGAATCP